MRVEVVIAWPHRFEQRVLELEPGATVADAVRLAALDPAGETAGHAVFGTVAQAQTRLCDGDRVELLRPLQLDPKEARRRRAGAQGTAR